MQIAKNVLATRAIVSVYIRRIVLPFVSICLVVLLVLNTGLIYLVLSRSAWWLFMWLPFLLLTLGAIVVCVVGVSIVRIITPPLTSRQLSLAKKYVSNMNEVNEALHTPYIIVGLRIAYDLLRRKGTDSYLQRSIKNSTQLKHDFNTLAVSFE